MAISDDLFAAILAMDAYNRGYNAGLKLSNDVAIGDAQVSVAKGDVEAQNAGFFAQAYTWNNPTTGNTADFGSLTHGFGAEVRR